MLILSLVFFTCESKEQNPMVGDWIDQKTEFAQINISVSKGDLWLTTRGKKYQIQSENDKQFVEINNRRYSLFYNDTDRVLSFNNIFYIPESESVKNTFLGKWSWANQDESLVFDIKLENGGLVWDISKNNKEPVRYYPKRTKEGFTFTYEDRQLFFTIIDKCIIDSDGRKFCKS